MRRNSGGAGLYGRKPPASRSALSLTPLIDVVFILLLFFMLVTNTQPWRTLRVDTAAGANAGVAEPAPALLELTRDGIVFAGQELAPQTLAVALREQLAIKPGLRLLVQADDRVPVQRLVAVLDLVRVAGVPELRLTRREVP